MDLWMPGTRFRLVLFLHIAIAYNSFIFSAEKPLDAKDVHEVALLNE